ncbi:MAG: glycosyltransferase [Fimbriimonadaceae bacterium]|nr:glycosyltransferase [Fimbriimonadaceae bacterium]
MVSIVVPAYNEAERIVPVLRAALGCALADEVIVVNDASLDATSRVAASVEGVRVIDLPTNHGKGGAMAAGARAAKGDVLVFVDADLVGIRAEHIGQIVRPMIHNECDMCIGVFRGGKFWSTNAQVIFPWFSGQRAIKRSLFERIPYLTEIGMGAEITINTFARRYGARVKRVILQGVSNTHKERKLGVVRGTAARAKMYKEMAHAVVRAQRRRPKAPFWK